MKSLKICIWLFFWLLMFEGALRKWILPGLTNPLIVVKDPVVIAAYLLALTHGRFPRNPFVIVSIILGVAASVISIVASTTGLNQGTLLVTLYGFRTNFLYIPFIFLIGDTFTWEDVRKMGKWTLLLALPMAVLVFLQFKSPSEALVNVGVGKSLGGQMDAGFGAEEGGRSRASGLFSFNTGLATYLAMVAAFVIHHFLHGGIYRRSLAGAAMIALGASTVLSLSRGITVSVVLVCAFGILCVALQPKLTKGLVGLVGGVVVLGILFLSTRVAKEGAAMLSNRFEMGDGLKVGIVGRTMSGFTSVFGMLGEQGFFGKGLGVGTNVGAGLLAGSRVFLIAENEWERIVGEVGPLQGLAYIVLRIGIAVFVFRRALESLKRGDSLAMLLFGACGFLILNGALGTAQTLAFMTLSGGLALAAAKRWDRPEISEQFAAYESSSAPPKLPRGRSAYAERLHAGRK